METEQYASSLLCRKRAPSLQLLFSDFTSLHPFYYYCFKCISENFSAHLPPINSIHFLYLYNALVYEALALILRH
jgi:hypothetical protein